MFMLFIDVSNNPDAILDQQAIDDEFYAAALRELVSIGLDVTRIIHQQIVAHSIDSPHSPVPEATSLAYERVTRAARRAIMLAKRHNAIPRETPGRRPNPNTAAAAPTRAAKEAAKDAENPDRPDRPEPPDRLDELDDRPTIELINELRQDLSIISRDALASREKDDASSTSHPPIEPQSNVARIAPSRCGNTPDETTPDETTPDEATPDETTPNKGPPYPPSS
jgi:hypothetical protein